MSSLSFAHLTLRQGASYKWYFSHFANNSKFIYDRLQYPYQAPSPPSKVTETTKTSRISSFYNWILPTQLLSILITCESIRFVKEISGPIFYTMLGKSYKYLCPNLHLTFSDEKKTFQFKEKNRPIKSRIYLAGKMVGADYTNGIALLANTPAQAKSGAS